jgi:multiple sugar transport system substrate-binding protein
MGTYNGKIMVLPRGLFVEGIMVDLDFLDKNNIDYPKYNWSTKDFEEILTKSKTNNSVGNVNVYAMRELLPGQLNPNLGWATYNDGKYSFNTGEWVEAVNYVKDIDSKQLTFESTPPIQRKSKFNTDDSFAAFTSGKVAMILDGSWTLSSIADAKVKFNWDFYPIPTKEGSSFSRPAMVADYLGISANSSNKKAAFEFSKWMSYSSAGYMKKLEIAQNGMKLFKKNKVVTEMPVTNSASDRQKWMEVNKFDVKGIKEIFKNLDKGFVDPLKTTPGYQKSYLDTIASQYGGIEKGTFSASDKANEFQTKANQYYKEAVDAINQ